MSARSCGFEDPGRELSLPCGEKCDRASFRAFETRMIALFLARGLFPGSKDSHDRTFLRTEGEKASLGGRSQVCISEVGASSRSARRPILGRLRRRRGWRPRRCRASARRARCCGSTRARPAAEKPLDGGFFDSLLVVPMGGSEIDSLTRGCISGIEYP